MPNTLRPVKIVVVGPGLIGRQHIRLIKLSSDCELVAIVAPDHEQNHLVAREQEVPLFFDMQSCIAEQSIDGVIISSPNIFHAEQGRQCIAAGIPTLIEKPICASVSEGEELVALAKRHNVNVLVGHHRAYSPILAHARRIIESGRLGRLVSIIGSAQFYKPTEYFSAGPWRTQVGGGPILINLIHEVGNLRSLCGEVSAVQAISSSAIRNFVVEDTVAINLMFANGALGCFLLSDTAASAMSWEQTSRENPAFPTSGDEDCYVVTGTRGYLSVPTFRLKYYAEGVNPSWLTPFVDSTLEIERRDPLACQLEHFVDVIRGRASPLVSAADGLQNLKVTEAIARSAIEGRLQSLEG